MKDKLPEHARDKPLEIWFQDEARVGQKGSLTRIWARRGSRPRAPRDTRYESAYLFGAVCPDRRTGAGIVMAYANAEALNAHLAEISRCVAESSHAALVLDGAGWHVAGELVIPQNITLVHLPPYSPELNPVENVWEYLAGTSSPCASTKATTPSSMPAAARGMTSWSRPTASPPSPRVNGRPCHDLCGLVSVEGFADRERSRWASRDSLFAYL